MKPYGYAHPHYMDILKASPPAVIPSTAYFSRVEQLSATICLAC
jgi:hypothetical protein